MRHTALHLALLSLLVVGLAAAASPAAAATDGTVTLYEAPDDDVDAAVAAVENGTADRVDRRALDDDLLVVVASERLAADLEAREGPTTSRLFAALDGEADLRVVQTRPSPERATKVAPLGPDNVTARRNGTTTYALLDLAALTFERVRDGENEPGQLRDGERYAVTFGYDLGSLPTDGPVVELYTASAAFDSRATTYDPLPPERVNRTVTVNVDPESELRAHVALDDGRNVTAPVGAVAWADGPGVSLDLRGVDPGTGYTLELQHDGEVVDRYEGTVTEPAATLTDVAVVDLGAWTGVNATASLSHGGAVTVHDGDGSRLGSASVRPGTETRVTVRLRGSADELRVRAAREEGAAATYYADAGTTIDVSDRELRDPRRLVTGTPTPSATTTTGADRTTDEQAGFGAGVAVAGLLAGALLARRREP